MKLVFRGFVVKTFSSTYIRHTYVMAVVKDIMHYIDIMYLCDM